MCRQCLREVPEEMHIYTQTLHRCCSVACSCLAQGNTYALSFFCPSCLLLQGYPGVFKRA